jgi:hypothetical protein
MQDMHLDPSTTAHDADRSGSSRALGHARADGVNHAQREQSKAGAWAPWIPRPRLVEPESANV